MLLLIGCAGRDAAPPPYSFEAYAEADGPAIVVEGLAGPVGLALDGDTLWVAEQGAGCVRSFPDEEAICDLDAPTWIDAEDGVVAWTGGGVASTPAGEVQATSPGRIRLVEGVAYWVDEAGPVYADATELGSFDTPRGIALADGEVRVADASGLATLEGRLVESEWPGRDLSEDGTVLLSRDDAWPGGGWLHDDAGSTLSSSPPWAERVAATDTSVYWSTDQGITRVDRAGGTYEVVAGLTAVGDLLVAGGWLTWTDPERGLVLELELE